MKKVVFYSLFVVLAFAILAVAAVAGVSGGYCGNGIIDTGERCELPGTQSNMNCPEPANTCSGNRLGERPSFGDCSALCKCVNDEFTYSCVKGACGAECASSEDCLQSTEKCVGAKLATRSQYAMCHFNCNCQETVFSDAKCVKDSCGAACSQDCDCSQTTESCRGTKTGTRREYGECTSGCQCRETPFLYTCVAESCGAECAANSDCSQDLTTCSGKKLGTRSGQCKSNCMCQYSPYKFQCVKDECGAACGVDKDCDDGNQATADKCASDCTCKHTPIPLCGDGIIGRAEQCESPGTSANAYCPESVNTCLGRRHGERAAFGDCNARCACEYKAYTYLCVVGQCGAQCASAEDCHQTTEKCVGNKLATRGPYAECHYNCNCQEIPFGDPKCVVGACAAQCSSDTDCIQSTEVCRGAKVGVRSEFGKCSSSCQCQETSPAGFVCSIGKCGAQCAVNSDCGQNEKCAGCMCICKDC